MTPLDTVLGWPWHKTVAVWAEAQDLYQDSWGPLLRVWYRSDD